MSANALKQYTMTPVQLCRRWRASKNPGNKFNYKLNSFPEIFDSLFSMFEFDSHKRESSGS